MTLTVLILAAGEGKRMRSDLPKVMHLLCGKPLLHHVMETVRDLKVRRTIVIVGHGKDRVRAALPKGVLVVDQRDPRGTGHALMRAARAFPDLKGTVLVMSGDVPLFTTETVLGLLLLHRMKRADMTLATAELDDPGRYGRILRDAKGGVAAIREASDASEEELAVTEVNAGLYAFRWERIAPLLRGLKAANRQKEYYLTDLIAPAVRRGYRVLPFLLKNPAEMMGANTRQDLALLHRILYSQKADSLMEEGVTLLQPSHAYIAPDVEVGRDTIIHPGVVIENSRIGSGCVLYPGNVIRGSSVGDGTVLYPHNMIEDSAIGRGCRVGPSAHLRPGTCLEDDVRVGNFVEIKKATLGRGTKAAHLTYLGDASIGSGVNIGCGTITCNYDGVMKSRTVIGDGAFIGSDCQLIAPVTVGRNAYTASGSTITEDVPAGALAIGRARQRNILGWVKKKKG